MQEDRNKSCLLKSFSATATLCAFLVFESTCNINKAYGTGLYDFAKSIRSSSSSLLTSPSSSALPVKRPITSSPVLELARKGSKDGISMSDVISASKIIGDQLRNCDTREKGLCCVMPNYCHEWAMCISEPPKSPSSSSFSSKPSIFGYAELIPRCKCPPGFQGDGKMKGTGCTNIDECVTGEATCTQLCYDHVPGYGCGCNEGYKLSRDLSSCDDIDECHNKSNGCEQTCDNLPGTYKCGCREGYVISATNMSACDDINECRLPGLGKCEFGSEACINTIGGYECLCPLGYMQSPTNKKVCVDIDECHAFGKNPCLGRANMECLNFAGGFACVCSSGYRTSSFGNLSYKNTMNRHVETLVAQNVYYAEIVKQAKEQQCVDIDECLEFSCVVGAQCVNIPGGFHCECEHPNEHYVKGIGCELVEVKEVEIGNSSSDVDKEEQKQHYVDVVVENNSSVSQNKKIKNVPSNDGFLSLLLKRLRIKPQ